MPAIILKQTGHLHGQELAAEVSHDSRHQAQPQGSVIAVIHHPDGLAGVKYMDIS